MGIIYIDRSPLCQLGMKALLAQDIFCLSYPSTNLLQSEEPPPNLVIMSFPEQIYLFEEYLLFLEKLRTNHPKIKTLFFIDKASPLILALIARARPDAILNKKEKLNVVLEMCMLLIEQERPVANGHMWGTQKPTIITPGEIIVLCEIARNASIGNIAQRLHLHPKTVYSHLNNASKKFGIRNRVELLKMIAML
ncbi:response regulator transcription factor [Serratia sp. D1N4]